MAWRTKKGIKAASKSERVTRVCGEKSLRYTSETKPLSCTISSKKSQEAEHENDTLRHKT
jgi:hypothetical protein